MVELDFFTKITRKPLEWVIAELHGAAEWGEAWEGAPKYFRNERAR